jgi:hypothetical protein
MLELALVTLMIEKDVNEAATGKVPGRSHFSEKFRSPSRRILKGATLRMKADYELSSKE